MRDTLKLFIEELFEFLTSKLTNDEHTTIIRKHSDSLHKYGDISFPVEIKCWLPHLLQKKAKDSELEEIIKVFNKCCEVKVLTEKSNTFIFKIDSATTSLDRINLFLHRPKCIQTGIIQTLENENVISHHITNKTLTVFLDTTEKSEDSLSNLRVKLVGKFINNVVCATERKISNVSITARSSFKVADDVILVMCGPVLNIKTNSKEENITAEDYVRRRQNEMTLIAQHKYGLRNTQDQRWKGLVLRLGEAAVRFELLQAKPAAPVKINFDNPTDGCSRGASFVLYNCARLETLLKTFRERVCSGLYPELPPLEDIDFSVLTDEDEWTLSFNHVLGFPSVLSACLRTDGGATVAAPHLLCSFLCSLVHVFSQYYRRVRILTEARAHLLPVLFARVHLLLALQSVLKTSLSLLDIDAVSQM